MNRARGLAIGSSIVVAMLTLVAPASMAVPPEVVFDETFEDQFTVPAGEVCEFSFVITSTGQAIHKHFFNKHGEVVKHQTWASGTETATNPESGKTLKGRFSVSDFQRQHGDEFGPIEVRGLVFHFNAPGAGAVLMDAGRVVFDFDSGDIISVSGPHQELEGDFEAFCEALA